MTRLNDVELLKAPTMLYVAGDVKLLRSGRRVAVVGSRNASDLGLRRARLLVQALVSRDIIVVSGLAAGIDTAAHQAAIEFGGRTIAVLGTPLDQCYPAFNAELKEQIERNHALVSQFPVGSRTLRQNFPQRNRTMALLTDATVIVEAKENSGTQHQGWEGLRLGREVFLLANLFDDPALSWPREMVDYGAQILTRNNIIEMLNNLPSFTDREDSDAIDF